MKMKTARFLDTVKWNSRKPEEGILLCLWLLAVGCWFNRRRRSTSSFQPKAAFFLFFYLAPFLLFCQGASRDSFNLVFSFPEKAKYFTLDKLRQVYVVTSTNEVVKYSPEGRELFRYNNNTRGNLAYIDATDPFKLLLFYPELQAISILDRTMNETALLLLFSADIVNASAIALANDNNIWVYDQATFRLLKVASDGTVLASSDNLSAQLARPPRVKQVLARENMVYLNDPEQGIFLFDGFAQYHQLLPLSGYDYFGVLDGYLQLFKRGELYAYNLKALKKIQLPVPGAAREAVQLRRQGQRLYALSDGGVLSVYEKNEEGRE